MSYTLEELSRDIHQVLTDDPGPDGKQQVCKLVSRALLDSAFVAQHLTAEQCTPRKVLYEDPELGFCICGHVYPKIRGGNPHDHGPSWAIYGLADGGTEMTDWEIVEQGDGDAPTLVKPVRVYDLELGESHYYAPGDVHSPRLTTVPVKLVRVEGSNLDNVQRSNIRAA